MYVYVYIYTHIYSQGITWCFNMMDLIAFSNHRNFQEGGGPGKKERDRG